MIHIVIFLIFFPLHIVSDVNSENLAQIFLTQPDYGVTTAGNIRSRGYGYELHSVHSEGGFVLALHRIVNYKFQRTRSAVLMLHGLLGSSNEFISNDLSGRIDDPPDFIGPNLGFELAKRGHDVWLSDQRASPPSNNNTLFSPSERGYWEYSNDEIALFDLPALIDYIRRTTGRQQIGYIGHSQGTQIMFSLLSKIPKYNYIIKPYIALGPAVFYANSIPNRIPLIHNLPLNEIAAVLNIVGGPLLADPLRQFISILCSNRVDQAALCIPLGYLGLTIGSYLLFPNLPAFDPNRVPVYLSASFPLTLSSHQAAGSLQLIATNRPAMTDYNPEKNRKLYGSEIPPVYNMGNVTNPYIALFSAKYDVIADPYDVSQLRDQLGVKPMFHVEIKDLYFGHLSFTQGISEKVVSYVVKPILSIMSSLYPW